MDEELAPSSLIISTSGSQEIRYVYSYEQLAFKNIFSLLTMKQLGAVGLFIKILCIAQYLLCLEWMLLKITNN